jgi:hypothetical protein
MATAIAVGLGVAASMLLVSARLIAAAIPSGGGGMNDFARLGRARPWTAEPPAPRDRAS